MQIMHSRRRFLINLSAAGTAALAGSPKSLHAEPAPETTTVRLLKILPANCDPPSYVAGELLRAEGFSVSFVELQGDGDPAGMIARGELDFYYDFAPAHIMAIEARQPITVLAGVHSGCLELIANDGIRSVTDLRGKKVGVDSLTSQPHLLVTLMAAHVGLDPARDIEWITSEKTTSMQLFGEIDAFLGIPPEPQELRARKIGHTILNSAVDRPWSQYICCLLAAGTDYATKYPVATKRVMRAVLKGADLCVSEPAWVAKRMVDGGFTDQYGYTLESLTDVRYDTWRAFDPEDTVRFYALRMHESGFIKSSPQKIIADGTDWRFLEEVKRELKT